MTDTRVGQTALAHEGGALLAADVNGLNASQSIDHSHLTVIGHSYGSTTVADAAAGYGMRADDAVLIGSPGTDLARTAGDFHLPEGGHVFVGAASTDPVSHLGILQQVPEPGSDVNLALGTDPALNSFGATRFQAEIPGLRINDHSHYYDPGTESLYSMSDIASGHGDVLQDHEMTAPHRIDLLAHRGPVADPEFYRLPPTAYRLPPTATAPATAVKREILSAPRRLVRD